MIRLIAVLSFILAPALAANAQFVSSGGGSGSPSSGGGASGSGVQDQGDNVTDTFAGLTFQVLRIVQDPSIDNAYRLILRVIETEKTGRRVALVKPAATLIDDIGNVRYVAASTGVPICTRQGKAWEYGTDGCARYLPSTPVFLTPGQPAPIVFTLLPFEGAFSADLAGLATTASLNARFAIYSTDLKTSSFYDVVINGIALPLGGT